MNKEELPMNPAKRGWLKNGNPPGDPSKAPRCGARTRAGNPCMCPAMPNGRCRLHGGKSTGPRTTEGLKRSQEARLTHGMRTRAAREETKRVNDLVRQCKAVLREL